MEAKVVKPACNSTGRLVPRDAKNPFGSGANLGVTGVCWVDDIPKSSMPPSTQGNP